MKDNVAYAVIEDQNTRIRHIAMFRWNNETVVCGSTALGQRAWRAAGNQPVTCLLCVARDPRGRDAR